jgi:hypothetical protein
MSLFIFSFFPYHSGLQDLLMSERNGNRYMLLADSDIPKNAMLSG